MKATYSQIRVARVLHEDPDFVTLEVCKTDERKLRINEGDSFLTILFILGQLDSRGPVTIDLRDNEHPL